MLSGFDAGLLAGILIGAGAGFLIAMWFQTAIVLKFKEELVNWFLEQEDADV